MVIAAVCRRSGTLEDGYKCPACGGRKCSEGEVDPTWPARRQFARADPRLRSAAVGASDRVEATVRRRHGPECCCWTPAQEVSEFHFREARIGKRDRPRGQPVAVAAEEDRYTPPSRAEAVVAQDVATVTADALAWSTKSGGHAGHGTSEQSVSVDASRREVECARRDGRRRQGAGRPRDRDQACRTEAR